MPVVDAQNTQQKPSDEMPRALPWAKETIAHGIRHGRCCYHHINNVIILYVVF